MNSSLLEIALVLLLVFGNGFLVMAEISISSARRGVLQTRAAAGDRRAARALQLAEHPDPFLSTAQIGITLGGIVAGAIGGGGLAHRLAEVLASRGWTDPYLSLASFGVVIAGIAGLFLVMGEFLPKRLARHAPEFWAGLLAPPMHVLSRAVAPVLAVLGWSMSGVLRLLRIRKLEENRMSREEFTVLVNEGLSSGTTDANESRMMERVFNFETLDVYDLMIPRPKMVWIDRDASHGETWPMIVRSTHTFFPVFEGNRDNLVGIISVKDIYAQLAAGLEVDFRHLIQTPLMVPETQMASVLLETFRSTGHHVAIVVNEYGGVVGMVTLMDLMESIVGDVPSREERLVQPIRERGDGSWLIDGVFEIEKLGSHLTDFRPPSGAGDEYQTVAGWFAHCLARIPAEGDSLQESGWHFEIIDIDGIRVDKVLAMPQVPQKIAS